MVRDIVSLKEVLLAVEVDAVASDIDFTRDSNSLRAVGDVSISRMSCSIPCCSWRAKSSSVKSGSGGAEEEVDVFGGGFGP